MSNKKIFVLMGIFALSILALSFFVSAFTLPPIVSITASPSLTTSTSTIVAIATDLSGSGIKYVRIYESGVLVKQCQTLTCVYVAVHSTPGVRSYSALVADNAGSSTTSNIINVNFQNSAPILNAIGNKTINENSLLSFVISGVDYNSDSLTYSATVLPTGATLNNVTGAFSWTPSCVQNGTYPVTFSVSDGSLSDSEVVTLTVNDVVGCIPTPANNSAPILTAIGNKAVNENSTLSFIITASDVDADPLTYSATGLPIGAMLNSSSGSFVWTPTFSQSGVYAINFLVSDGSLSDSETINITVNDVAVSDSESPKWFNLTASPASPNTYSSSQIYQFNSTWTDNLLVENVWIQFDNVNYSVSGISGVYDFSITGLTVGTHTYAWYANDTNGNVNSTDILTHIVNSASNSTNDNDDDDDDSNDGGKIKVVSDTDLTNGYYVSLNVNDRLKFTLCGSPYYVKLTDADEEDNNAYFLLTPTTRSFVLDEGDKEEFDLNNNQVNDILFRLENVDSNDKVKVYIKKLVDVCAGDNILISGDTTTISLTEKISSVKKSNKGLIYLIFALMFGILFAALAILLTLLRKSKYRIKR